MGQSVRTKMSTTGFPEPAKKGSAGVPSRCRAVFGAVNEEGTFGRPGVALGDGASCLDAPGTPPGVTLESLPIAAKQARKTVMARISKRDEANSRCFSRL